MELLFSHHSENAMVISLLITHWPSEEMIYQDQTLSGFHCTWDSWGLFQLTGTKAFELDPDDVEEVLRVTAMTFGFPFLHAALC